MYKASTERYSTMPYFKCGNSGLKLPGVSLGLWHNYGENASMENMKDMIFTAFNHGITHFDLANNYGPEPGRAEINFGKILKEELSDYRDEMIISTKAGYLMWDGPYGDWGSRKYLLLAQGLLTNRYLNGIPADSRVKTDGRFLKETALTEEKLAQIRQLNELAAQRGQTLAEMALSWVLKDGIVTSVLIGASKSEQILDNIKALENTNFTAEELNLIDQKSLI